MEEERRRRTRVPVQFEVAVQVQGEPVAVETENISLNGMLCRPEGRLKAGDDGEVRITLSPEAVIAARGRIVRSDAQGLAVAFSGLSEESFFHLKKLVQYNAGDADVVERELGKAGF